MMEHLTEVCHRVVYITSWGGESHFTHWCPNSLPPPQPSSPREGYRTCYLVICDVAVPFFCRELRCVPDIWSLVEWSDWLTPRNMGRRYDTVFYLCCCETTPPISADGTEVVDAKVRVLCVYV